MLAMDISYFHINIFPNLCKQFGFLFGIVKLNFAVFDVQRQLLKNVKQVVNKIFRCLVIVSVYQFDSAVFERDNIHFPIRNPYMQPIVYRVFYNIA